MEFNNKSSEHMLEFFYDTCFQICKKEVPTRDTSVTSQKPRMKRRRENLARRRRRINKRLVRITSPSLKQKLNQELVDIELELQESYRDMYETREHEAINAIKKIRSSFTLMPRNNKKLKLKLDHFL